jgi:3'(2'), 5'-bisphosphate nucleotidase
MKYQRELTEALTAAATAAAYVLTEYERFTPIPNAPASISTHVDREAQEIILRHLREAFPDDGVCAEEGDTADTGDRVWVVDPIDGTRGFAMKNGEFSVMVGLTDGGRPVLGVVVEPVLERVTYAAEGFGCWVLVGDGDPDRCRVTDRATLSEAVLVQSRTKSGAGPKPLVRAIGPASVVETYSAGIKLAMVARGEVDLYVNDYAGFHDWDVCAGHVLVEEAGGRLSLFDGRPITYGVKSDRPGGMVASNGRLHDETVRRLGTP